MVPAANPRPKAAVPADAGASNPFQPPPPSYSYHRPPSANGALSAPHPMMLPGPPQRSDREPAPNRPRPPDEDDDDDDDAEDADLEPYKPSPLRPSRVTAHFSRMNFPSLYFSRLSAASSCDNNNNNQNEHFKRAHAGKKEKGGR